MSLKEYYRPDEIMAKMEISKATFYRYTSRVENPLPAVKMGPNGSLRVKVTDFDNWIEQNKVNNLEN